MNIKNFVDCTKEDCTSLSITNNYCAKCVVGMDKLVWT